MKLAELLLPDHNSSMSCEPGSINIQGPVAMIQMFVGATGSWSIEIMEVHLFEGTPSNGCDASRFNAVIEEL